jgi:hypothetical protein
MFNVQCSRPAFRLKDWLNVESPDEGAMNRGSTMLTALSN